jgi:putative membrane protein
VNTAEWIEAWTAGAAVGAAAGLVPGFHTNTLAALLLALAPNAGEFGAHFILAAATAHLFSSLVPATYVGVPSEEAALTVLPAHRMTLASRGRDAVRTGADATLLAIVAAILLVLPYKWLVLDPGRALDVLGATVPFVAGGALVWLVWQEKRKSWRAAAWAASCTATSGALGIIAGLLHMVALVPVPATPLLPLLSGLFGASGLVFSLLFVQALPPQLPAPRRAARDVRRAVTGGAWRGIAAAGWTAAMPGFTPAVAASVASVGSRSTDSRAFLACQAAVGAAHHVFTILILWLTLHARTGTAIAVQDFVVIQRWDWGRPPDPLVPLLATLLAAAVFGYAVTRGLDGVLHRPLCSGPPRLIPAVALLLLVAVVACMTGPMGLLLFAIATVVGLLPLAAGVRRVHLTGAILVPFVAARLGLTA